MSTDKRPHIPARYPLDRRPQVGGLPAAAQGGLGVTARGVRITVGIMRRTDWVKMPCVESGTHPEELPHLSTARVTVRQIEKLFTHHTNRALPTEFD